MLSLCAIEPDRRRCVLDLVCECRVGDRLCAGGGNEARPEAVFERLARRRKCGLGDGVVLGPEAEGDGIALSSFDAVWLENQIAALATDSNEMLLSESGASEGGSSEDGREMHYDWLRKKESSSFGYRRCSRRRESRY